MDGRVLWLNGKYQAGHSPRETNKQMFTLRQVNTTLTHAGSSIRMAPFLELGGGGGQGFGLRNPGV